MVFLEALVDYKHKVVVVVVVIYGGRAAKRVNAMEENGGISSQGMAREGVQTEVRPGDPGLL